MEENTSKCAAIQWHPALCSSAHLEFMEDRDYLEFTEEYCLNSQPLHFDQLIIKKNKEIELQNELGKLFKGHNILEYKSPEDSLGIDEYFKTIAYACLYKSLSDVEDAIKFQDITITLVREKFPRKLFQYFKQHNYHITRPYQGIYYVKAQNLFLTQVVVQNELDPREHVWLTSLTRNLDMERVKRLVDSRKALTGQGDIHDAESVMEVVIHANDLLFEKVRENENMCEALMELMAPEFNAALEREVAKAEERATARGECIGKELLLIEQVCKKMRKGIELVSIAEQLEEDFVQIQKIYDAAILYEPEYNAREIYAVLHQGSENEKKIVL